MQLITIVVILVTFVNLQSIHFFVKLNYFIKYTNYYNITEIDYNDGS